MWYEKKTFAIQALLLLPLAATFPYLVLPELEESWALQLSWFCPWLLLLSPILLVVAGFAVEQHRAMLRRLAALAFCASSRLS